MCPLETGVDKDHDAGGKKLSRGRQTGEPGRRGTTSVVAVAGRCGCGGWRVATMERHEDGGNPSRVQVDRSKFPNQSGRSTTASRLVHRSSAGRAHVHGIHSPHPWRRRSGGARPGRPWAELDHDIHRLCSTASKTRLTARTPAHQDLRLPALSRNAPQPRLFPSLRRGPMRAQGSPRTVVRRRETASELQ